MADERAIIGDTGVWAKVDSEAAALLAKAQADTADGKESGDPSAEGDPPVEDDGRDDGRNTRHYPSLEGEGDGR
jgi:hypothetical protein